MFNHITVGSDNLEKSKIFYDAVFEPLGIKSFGAIPDTMVLYGAESPQFMVMKPINGEPARSANGGTIGFKAATRSAVDTFHKIGCEQGGRCEGPPGPRENGPPGNYVAYLRDPFGNKLVAVTYSAE